MGKIIKCNHCEKEVEENFGNLVPSFDNILDLGIVPIMLELI